MSEICGITPEASTLRTKTSPYAARLATPSWIRAPPESLSPMSGTPLSRARSLIRLILLRLHPRHRPAEDREVLGEHGDAAAVDLAEPGHHAVAREALAVQPERRLVVGGEGAHLLERAVVEQQGEPLAGRELAARVLGRDALGPTTLHGARAHGAEGVEMFGHTLSLRPGSGSRQRPIGTGAGRGWRGSTRAAQRRCEGSEPPPAAQPPVNVP